MSKDKPLIDEEVIDTYLNIKNEEKIALKGKKLTEKEKGKHLKDVNKILIQSEKLMKIRDSEEVISLRDRLENVYQENRELKKYAEIWDIVKNAKFFGDCGDVEIEITETTTFDIDDFTKYIEKKYLSIEE